MRISLDLGQNLEDELRKTAASLGVSVESLATAAIRNLLVTRNQDLEPLVKELLEKNDSLYRRLA
jgi:hypothetical protein